VLLFVAINVLVTFASSLIEYKILLLADSKFACVTDSVAEVVKKKYTFI